MIISRRVVTFLFWVAFLRLVTAVDIITTIAGTGDVSYSGDNGAATSATVSYPGGVALDSSGNNQHYLLTFLL